MLERAAVATKPSLAPPSCGRRTQPGALLAYQPESRPQRASRCRLDGIARRLERLEAFADRVDDDFDALALRVAAEAGASAAAELRAV